MQQFKGYTKWPSELREVALERLLNEYFEDRLIIAHSVEDYAKKLTVIIEQDITFYEKIEEYELCQMLNDLKKEL